MWGADNPGFVKQLFGWVNRHKRVKMMRLQPGREPERTVPPELPPEGTGELKKRCRNPRFLASVGE